MDDIGCDAWLPFVCEYDIYGVGHAASSSSLAGVVLRGSYIECGFNSGGSIGMMCVLVFCYAHRFCQCIRA